MVQKRYRLQNGDSGGFSRNQSATLQQLESVIPF